MLHSRTWHAALGALALGGACLAWSEPASAGASTGTWRNGMVAGPVGVGYYGYRGGFRPGHYGGYHGGLRPAYYGGYRGYGGFRTAYNGGYNPYPRPYYRRRDNGAAVAAGLIGGLALGALATAPYRYSYPATYGGGYYGASYYDQPTCYSVRRRYIDAWGRMVVRRTDICE